MIKRTMTALRMLFVVVCLAFIATGCDDDPPSSSTSTLVCSDDATPVLLASKADDEDGDGNILDEKFPTIDDEDDDIADHAWIRDHTGTYHLFFHTEGRGAPNFIEHYTSHDLEHLNYVGVALSAPASGWDAGGLWAPHVIQDGDTYYMFYTGVDRVAPGAVQRIGVATSTDLVHWSRLPVNHCPGTSGDGCVYEGRESWTTWGVAGDLYNDQCRDPFVIRDDNDDQWLLFATARSVNGYGVVTVAASRNLSEWTGVGYIDATRRLASGTEGQPTGGQAENPFVIAHAGDYYLLFTDWQDPEDSLDVDSLGSAGWTYRGYTPDPGVNAIEVLQDGFGPWIMSQSLSNPHTGYVKPIRRMLRLKCIEWEGGFRFSTATVGFEAPASATPVSSP